jgi:hypothetical protein
VDASSSLIAFSVKNWRSSIKSSSSECAPPAVRVGDPGGSYPVRR